MRAILALKKNGGRVDVPEVSPQIETFARIKVIGVGGAGGAAADVVAVAEAAGASRGLDVGSGTRTGSVVAAP